MLARTMNTRDMSTDGVAERINAVETTVARSVEDVRQVRADLREELEVIRAELRGVRSELLAAERHLCWIVVGFATAVGVILALSYP